MIKYFFGHYYNKSLKQTEMVFKSHYVILRPEICRSHFRDLWTQLIELFFHFIFLLSFTLSLSRRSISFCENALSRMLKGKINAVRHVGIPNADKISNSKWWITLDLNSSILDRAFSQKERIAIVMALYKVY